MTETAGLKLDADYCGERLAVLEDLETAETKKFIELYGADYHRRVISWFQKAQSEQ